MKKYIVTISELLSREIEVESESISEARKKVMEDYYKTDIVLSADDYVSGSVQFDVEEVPITN